MSRLRACSRLAAFASLLFVTGLAARARAADTVLTFEGEVPADGAYFEIPFDVPAGNVEIEVRHDDLSAANILDWGLLAPSGFRGYGGGNEEPAVVGVAAASRSYLPGAIEAGTWRVYVGKARIAETPARYRVEVVLRDAPTLAPQPERAPYAPAAALEVGRRWYAGDFHVHTRESGDAAPSLDEVATFAESRGLDFVMLSDHNTTSQLELVAATQAAHPALLLVPGVEVTTYEGHAMALGGTQWVDHRLGFAGRTVAAIADEVHAQGALFTLNHPVLDLGDACIGCAWTSTLARDAIDGIELQTGALSVTGVFYARSERFWEDLVAGGAHVVAIGGSDDHRAGRGTGMFDSPIGSPTTMVEADELSVAALLAGIRRGRTAVKLEGPDDPLVALDSPQRPTESDTIVADSMVVRVRVTGAAMGSALRLVRDGASLPAVPVTSDPFEWETTLEATGTGEDFVRAELLVGGRPRVVTSHLFLRGVTERPDAGVGAPDAGAAAEGAADEGCGCRVVAGARPARALPTWMVLAAVIGLDVVRRARRRTRRVLRA
jgi:hypothetical protein